MNPSPTLSKLASLLLGAGVLCFGQAGATEKSKPMPMPMPDQDLPQGLDPKLVGNLLQNSPFTRTVDPAETYELTGVAYINGKPVVTLLNKFTKQSFVVSDTPNPRKWAILEVSPNDDLTQTNVRMVIEDEIVSFYFTEDQLAPEDKKKAAKQPAAAPVRQPAPAPAPQTPQRSVHLSDETRQQYLALPDEGKQKYKQIMEETKDKAGSATPEMRAAFKTSIIERLSKAAQSGNLK